MKFKLGSESYPILSGGSLPPKVEATEFLALWLKPRNGMILLPIYSTYGVVYFISFSFLDLWGWRRREFTDQSSNVLWHFQFQNRNSKSTVVCDRGKWFQRKRWDALGNCLPYFTLQSESVSGLLYHLHLLIWVSLVDLNHQDLTSTLLASFLCHELLHRALAVLYWSGLRNSYLLEFPFHQEGREGGSPLV